MRSSTESAETQAPLLHRRERTSLAYLFILENGRADQRTVLQIASTSRSKARTRAAEGLLASAHHKVSLGLQTIFRMTRAEL